MLRLIRKLKRRRRYVDDRICHVFLQDRPVSVTNHQPYMFSNSAMITSLTYIIKEKPKQMSQVGPIYIYMLDGYTLEFYFVLHSEICNQLRSRMFCVVI